MTKILKIQEHGLGQFKIERQPDRVHREFTASNGIFVGICNNPEIRHNEDTGYIDTIYLKGDDPHNDNILLDIPPDMLPRVVKAVQEFCDEYDWTLQFVIGQRKIGVL